MSEYNQGRSRIIQIIFAAVFLIIVLQLMNLQIFSSEYTTQAESNAIYRKVVYPDRGIIFDRKGKAILGNTVMYDLMVTPSEIKGTDTLAICAILRIDTAEFKKRILNARFKNSAFKPSVFEPLISNELYARLNENMYRFNGFTIIERPVRDYPFHAAACVLGYLGEVDTSFLRKHKGEGYESGDYTGIMGLERSYESVLMGQRGVTKYIRDNKSRIQGSYKNGTLDTQAIAGRNLYTSMDIELQQLAEKLMTNKIGACVAINPKTGGILAMATGPTYDPEMLTGAARRKNYGRLVMDTARPMYNRAIKGQYPPGSTFKPLGALVALDEGLITPSYGYGCGGGYHSCGRTVKCTHSGGGHAATLRLALANSCNSYFCQVFRMAIDNPAYKTTAEGYLKWKEYMNGFGLGVKLGIDIPGEDDANIPDTAAYNRDFGGAGRWNSCNMVTLGIGQDRMTATPLQLANYMCVVANKGYFYTPHFVDSIEDENINDTAFLNKYRIKHKVTNISDSSFEAVHLGMHDVTIYGTATRVKIDGIDICAKTGTAQNPHGKNHSIFVAFAPMENPQIAIAVIVENAGYGATWAGPIVSLMLEKYLKDSLTEKSRAELERVSKADLIPPAIKHWYYVKDSLRTVRLNIDANKAPEFKNNIETSKRVQFDPEAEPDRKDDGKDSGRAPVQKDIINPNEKRSKKDSLKNG